MMKGGEVNHGYTPYKTQKRTHMTHQSVILNKENGNVMDGGGGGNGGGWVGMGGLVDDV